MKSSTPLAMPGFYFLDCLFPEKWDGPAPTTADINSYTCGERPADHIGIGTNRKIDAWNGILSATYDVAA